MATMRLRLISVPCEHQPTSKRTRQGKQRCVYIWLHRPGAHGSCALHQHSPGSSASPRIAVHRHSPRCRWQALASKSPRRSALASCGSSALCIGALILCICEHLIWRSHARAAPCRKWSRKAGHASTLRSMRPAPHQKGKQARARLLRETGISPHCSKAFLVCPHRLDWHLDLHRSPRRPLLSPPVPLLSPSCPSLVSVVGRVPAHKPPTPPSRLIPSPCGPSPPLVRHDR